MKRRITQAQATIRYLRMFLIAATLLVAVSQTYAQLGNGWKAYSPTKKVHLDNVEGLQTFNWTAYKSVCEPQICADYNYESATDTETFRIFDSRSNRSEIRLQNEYSTGSRQFEGYVTIYPPLNDESLMQIFGSTSGATQMMLRGYAADGGSMRGAGKTVATNIYGKEVRVNVIHLQEDAGNKIQIYIEGVKMAEINDNENVTNYQKYGCYGTTNGNVPAVVKWRNVRVFRDGVSPDQTAFVSVTSPASGTEFTTPASVTINATALDANEAITKVEFFAGTTKIGEDIESPYSFVWNNAPIGTHLLTAKSINVSGNVAASSAVTITVKSPPAPQSPYLGVTHTIPGIIEAENYDEGGQGVAFNDLTAGNNYNVYRFESVDLQPTGDLGGGYNVALVASGEWVEYTVNVQTEASYKLDLRLAANSNGRALHVEMDGTNITGRVAVPNTGNYQVYQTVSIITPVLTAGQKVMRVFFETPSHNLNWIGFTIQRRTQTVTFEDIEDVTYGDEPLQVVATADSGLPVSIEVVSGAVLMEDGLLKITGAGPVTLRATQQGNADYFPASAEQTFTVQKAEQTITFGEIAPQLVSETVTLFATTSSGLEPSFDVISGPATLTGNILAFDGEGEVVVQASQPGNENYLAADNVQRSVLVFADDAKKDGLRLIVNPNPTKGKVKVKMDNKKDQEYSFVVYDKFGQVIESAVIGISHKMFEIDLEREPNGLYFLRVSDGTTTWVRKIIKE